MKTVIINGQSHKGSTYTIAHQLADKIGGELTEFFLPKDFGEFCTGCCNCFNYSETKCPHFSKLEPITKAIDEADAVILASPVYVYHCTGAMKSFLDHYGYRWMVHSPEESMFRKQAVSICTAAGAGLKTTTKDMQDSLFFWGAARRYSISCAVAATDWDSVSEKKKNKIDKETSAIAAKIIKRNGKVKPSLKTRGMFFIMHLMQKNGYNKRDVDYWNEKGWTGKKRPWK